MKGGFMADHLTYKSFVKEILDARGMAPDQQSKAADVSLDEDEIERAYHMRSFANDPEEARWMAQMEGRVPSQSRQQR